MPVSSELLITQVKNTAPFIFEADFCSSLKKHEQFLAFTQTPKSYFELCLQAHWATVGTFVPTDVDDLIRRDLWIALGKSPDESVLAAQLKSTEDCHSWDFRKVTERYVVAPLSKEVLAGHHGEWFSVAAAAFSYLLKSKRSELAKEWREKIENEISRHERIVMECWKSSSTHDLYRLAYLLAHNLGDLRRVLDDWKISEEQFPREFETRSQTFALLSEINTKKMALENHRHFALRKVRSLRKSRTFLLPIAPFLDSWGIAIAKHPSLNELELSEICEALIMGHLKNPDTEGYARALNGLIEATPGGLTTLGQNIPARWLREVKQGALHMKISKPRVRFEQQWNSRDAFKL